MKRVHKAQNSSKFLEEAWLSEALQYYEYRTAYTDQTWVPSQVLCSIGLELASNFFVVSS